MVFSVCTVSSECQVLLITFMAYNVYGPQSRSIDHTRGVHYNPVCFYFINVSVAYSVSTVLGHALLITFMAYSV